MADIDEFRLVRVLGRGAMGVVYLAHDTILERDVALKVVRVDLSEPSRQRLLTEARAIARLDHPNVVTIHRAGTTSNGEPYLIAELIDGEPLDRLPRPLAPARVLALGRGIARGLAAAHRRGVLHRDVKPSNIVVDASGTPRLLDFGLAKLSGSADPAAPVPSRAVSIELDATADQPGVAPPAPDVTPLGTPTNATQAGALIGTPRFMAPELWRGEPATARSDLYSLGVVLYELLAGEPPFPHSDRAALEVAVLAGEPPDLAVDGLDPQLAALVMRCLARDPAARPESADEVVHQLDRIAAGVAAIPQGNPYRGLAAFEASHRGVFFGREPEVSAIVERLRSASMVVVTGDSGIGKSSLCRAGVLPAVTGGALGDGRTWSSKIVALGRRPIAALEEWLAIDPAELAEGDLASRIARRLQLDASRGLIVLVDQLEELVTQAAPADAELAASVLAALAGGIPGLKLVAAVRGDFLTRVAALAGLRGAMMRDVHLVRGLSPEDAYAVIVGPASAKGVAFETPAMVDELVASIADRPTALPLLQFALAELWPRRDPNRAVIPESALREIGGVAGALALHADRVVTALGVPERTAARRILLALVTAGGTRAARDRNELTEQDPVATAALEALVTGRLVVARDTADGEPQYELAHESLLANWSTLRGWLDDSAGERHQRARLRAAAREWQRLGRRRDLLWRRAQLAEVARLDALPQLDREFVGASRRAGRLRLAIAIAIGLAVPLSVLATVLASDYRASQRRAARIDEQLAGARKAFAEADAIIGEAREQRDASIACFDRNDRDGGEERWAVASEQFTAASRKLRELATRLEGAVFDTGAAEVRTTMAEAIYRRMLVADEVRDEITVGELLERLASYDDGTFIARWRQAQPVTLVADGASRIELERYSVSATGARIPASVDAATGGRLSAKLAPGSYRARAIAPGIEPVLFPFIVERAPVSLAIALPPAGRVPPGFVYVPPGPFLIGAPDSEHRLSFFNAVPTHQTTTGAFLIGRTEVTFADWLAYLRALPPDKRAERQQHAPRGAAQSVRLEGGPPGPFTLVLQPASADALRAREGEPLEYPGRRVTWERLPASGISYHDAVAYAAWLAETGRAPNARLCREAEWERAARGADGRAFPHGDRLSPTDANYDATYGRNDDTFGPDEVGSYPASTSPFGLQDMVGNAFEWVARAPEADAFLRGGSWYFDAPSATAANRSVMNPGARTAILGTRICADL